MEVAERPDPVIAMLQELSGRSVSVVLRAIDDMNAIRPVMCISKSIPHAIYLGEPLRSWPWTYHFPSILSFTAISALQGQHPRQHHHLHVRVTLLHSSRRVKIGIPCLP